MLNAIRIWAAAVCAAAVAASVAQLAAPEGKIQKALRCVIGLFFVCCVMAPFAQGLSLSVGNFETGIDVQEQTAESLSQEVLRQTADGFGSNVRQIIEEALSAKQIFPEEISVSVHVGENDDIYINSIAIWLEKDTLSNTEEILRIVSEKTGVIPEILAGGEEVS